MNPALDDVRSAIRISRAALVAFRSIAVLDFAAAVDRLRNARIAPIADLAAAIDCGGQSVVRPQLDQPAAIHGCLRAVCVHASCIDAAAAVDGQGEVPCRSKVTVAVDRAAARYGEAFD